jgi:ring-1,2-phenylacetyl-CoA epoxidase subunit PaaE
VIHVLEQDAQEIDLFTGMVTRDKCRELMTRGWVGTAGVDTAFICGPEPMMLGIAAALKDAGMPEERIKFELFASAQPGRLARPVRSSGAASGGDQAEAAVTLDGSTQTIRFAKDTSILDAALQNDLDAPFACKAGVCSTCRCRVLEGEVEMVTNHALEDYEVEKGYVLSCQSYPLTDRVVVDYDQ